MPKTEKEKEYMKQWRLNNQDKVKQYNKNAVQDYSQGKIYKIVCNITNEVYFGSTKEKYLSRRLSRHKRYVSENLKNPKRKMPSSSQIIQRGNFDIILVETYPCKSKYELESRERYYIENNDCINKTVPTRTSKEYNEDNKDLIAAKRKEYNEKNKEYLTEKRKEKYTCVCGLNIVKSHKKRHELGSWHFRQLEKLKKR